jgi:5'-nucleotidase
MSAVAAACARLAHSLLQSHVETPRHVLLSANFPKGWNGEMRATRLGRRIYEEKVDFRSDPYGREYLWLGGPGVRHHESLGTDTAAYDEHVASVTPLLLDLTSHDDIPVVSKMVDLAAPTTKELQE